MSIHIGAKKGAIASTVLFPGDPMRAQHFAESQLKDINCFNEVRGMYGYTGYYDDKRLSIMGSGMGMPTLSIYANELINEYAVTTIIRVGTCGAFQPDLKVGDIILPLTSSTDSQINKIRFNGLDYAPCVSFDLLYKAYDIAIKKTDRVFVGGIFSTDSFYHDNPEWWKKWAAYGVLATEMETTALYTLAAKFKIDALSVLSVSDNLATGESSSAEHRQKNFTTMAEIALTVAP